MNKTTLTIEPGKQELFVYREFEAPRDLVFKAFTDPKLLPQWMAPCERTLHIDRFESINGGMYHFTHTDPAGNQHVFRGVMHEVSAPERLIRTFEYLNLPERGHVLLDTLRFEALPDNRTRLTIHSVFQSVSDRDGMVQAGMENGVNECYQALDELLTTMTTRSLALPAL
ncbi:MAG TPA: SRPBCC family protein [Puia sp.]|jgi:uncharacterized protein YndB with AHSA1/START domain|nr:SRPBCC family protein [Puia sp.]